MNKEHFLTALDQEDNVETQAELRSLVLLNPDKDGQELFKIFEDQVGDLGEYSREYWVNYKSTNGL